MTQILSLLTEDFVFQVSDRRFTNPVNGRVVHDDRNKAVAYGRHAAFAYTGYGQMPFMRTDKWLAEHLYRHPDLTTALKSLAERSTKAVAGVRSPSKPDERYHAFVGVGFARLQTDQECSPVAPGDVEGSVDLRPVILCVSNYLLADGREDIPAHLEFSTTVCPLQVGSALYLHVAGQRLPDGIPATLLNALQETWGDPRAIIRRLVAGVRISAARNSAVGTRLMVTVLPRTAVKRAGPLVGMPAPDTEGISLDELAISATDPTFIYINDDERSKVFGPWAVAPGSMMIREPSIEVRDE